MSTKLEELFDADYELLLYRLRAKGVSRCDAEDAVADAFVAALSCGAEVERGWLHVVSWRRAVDEERRRARTVTLLRRLAGRSERDDSAPDIADRVVESASAKDRLRCLRTLPERTQRVVAEIADELTTHEVAAKLGITQRSAESHLQRARVRLRAADLDPPDTSSTTSPDRADPYPVDGS